MNIQLLTDGGLEMVASKKDQRSILKLKNIQTTMAERSFVETVLSPLGYNIIPPEACGALTSAPLITDGKNVWGYMEYQVSSFLEELANGKSIIWTKG